MNLTYDFEIYLNTFYPVVMIFGGKKKGEKKAN